MRTVIARRFAYFALAVSIIAACVYVVERLVAAPLHVASASMEPTLHPGDRVLVDHRFEFKKLQRGDIIVFRIAPRSAGVDYRFRRDGGATQLMVKRVVALPGDRLEAHGGIVAIDVTTRLEEPYLKGDIGSTEIPPVELAGGEVYVLGDNRDLSVDSRRFGPVPRFAIVGVVHQRIWPFSSWGSVE